MSLLDSNRILLMQPRGYTVSDMEKDVALLANVTPPTGLISIAAYLEKQGFQADVLDGYAQDISDAEFRDYLLQYRPAYLGLSCTTCIFLDAVRVSRLAKSICPDITVVVGGTHVSALKELILNEYKEVDFVVVGEGEQTLEELMRKGAGQAASISGLVFRDPLSGQATFSGHRDITGLELDALPFPAYEKLKGFPRVYQLPLFNYPRMPATTCTTSRGCPYRCSYCDRSVFQQTFRYNSAEYVYEHMAYLKARFGIRHVLLYDDQFTYDRERVEVLCDKLAVSKLGMTFGCAVRAEHIDSALLKKMKAAGCWMISLGIETGDQELLAGHRKNPDLDFLAQRIQMIKQEGIRVKGLLMMGLPGETTDSIRRSMDYVLSLPLDEMNIARFTPFPGSPIYHDVHEQGTFHEDWNRMDCLHFQFIPKGMTEEEMERLFKEFYRAYFMRPGTILRYASMTWRSPDSLRRFFLNSAKFIRFARG